MKVAHVITGLQTGGAEVMLLRLLEASDRELFRPSVLALGGPGPIGDEIRKLGIPVDELGLGAGPALPLQLGHLGRWLRTVRPAVVQTWLYHADLVGGLAARAATRAPVIWGLHSSNLEPGIVKPATIRVAQACARLSSWLPEKIVCCSESTRELHERFGYRADKLIVIPNGFDLAAFRPDPSARISVRQELGLAVDTPLIGLVARFDPQKDHRTFVRAAGHACAANDRVHFLLCGDGVTDDNAELGAWIATAGIAGRCHLLGRRRDMARIQASFDVGTLSSVAVEALPLAIGEAMACGVSCVVTDVGDSARLVGDTGRVVAPSDPVALAAAWLDVLAFDRAARTALGTRARLRIEEHYALPHIVHRYEALYDQLGARQCAV